jgi:hypothetical protein
MDLIYSSRSKGARVVFVDIDITEGLLRSLLIESFVSRIIDILKTSVLSFHPT